MIKLIITIKNFKSIGEITLELAPLTILIGPPAAGKSNILDAIGLTGYFHRLIVLDKEYGNNLVNIEPIKNILRMNDPIDLFGRKGVENIELTFQNTKQLKIDLKYQQGTLKITINNSALPWNLIQPLPNPNQRNNIQRSLINTLNNFKDSLIDSRIYGFDRYGLSLNFHRLLKGQNTKTFPANVLSELGWNSPLIARRKHYIIHEINKFVKDMLEEEIDIKVLRNGSIIVFDYDYEVDLSLISDSMYRMIYYLLALSSSYDYAGIYSLDRKMIVTLEEPEAHVFPYLLGLLTDKISEIIKRCYVIVSTHNPLFASLLQDRIKDVRVYYVYRDQQGNTNARELNIEKMAEELKTIEDIIVMKPSEVIEKYSKKPKEYVKIVKSS